jgi:hypothetical protein
MVIPFEKGVCEMRMRSQQIDQEIEGEGSAFFEAHVESIRHLVAAYADVVSGETFSLHEPQAVFERWDRQIAALRSLSEALNRNRKSGVVKFDISR